MHLKVCISVLDWFSFKYTSHVGCICYCFATQVVLTTRRKEGLKEEKQKSIKKEEMTDNIIENKNNKKKMKQTKAYGK